MLVNKAQLCRSFTEETDVRNLQSFKVNSVVSLAGKTEEDEIKKEETVFKHERASVTDLVW